jgi:hypothetical protein
MSNEVELLLHLPAESPELAGIESVAGVLGAPVVDDPGQSPRVRTDGLLVYGVRADDDDRELAHNLFGLDINLTLVFVNLALGDTAGMIRVEQSIMKVMLNFAAVPGCRGVYVEDYASDAVILRFEDGTVTLNRDWEGWALWPEVLQIIPEPRRLEKLRGND